MKLVRTLTAGLALLLLAGCAPTPTTPIAGVTVSAAPATAATPSATQTATPSATVLAKQCKYGDISKYTFFTMFSSWDLVKASYGMSLHLRTVKDLARAIKTVQRDEEPAVCTGHDELVAFAARPRH